MCLLMCESFWYVHWRIALGSPTMQLNGDGPCSVLSAQCSVLYMIFLATNEIRYLLYSIAPNATRIASYVCAALVLLLLLFVAAQFFQFCFIQLIAHTINKVFLWMNGQCSNWVVVYYAHNSVQRTVQNQFDISKVHSVIVLRAGVEESLVFHCAFVSMK